MWTRPAFDLPGEDEVRHRVLQAVLADHGKSLHNAESLLDSYGARRDHCEASRGRLPELYFRYRCAMIDAEDRSEALEALRQRVMLMAREPSQRR